MLKLTTREIARSLGRYLAILAIVALGVGFFCGLRLTKTAMLRTLDQYTTELNFYDYRLVSSVGLSEQDAAAAAALGCVAEAEGSKAADALASVGEKENLVFHCISLPERVNTLRLTAGRLPEAADECAADAWSFSEADLGKTVVLSDENDEDTLGKFAGRRFTIVGIVHSPLYINFERGGSEIGSGSVAAFLYLGPGAFTMDYDTDLYLKLKDAPGEVYSQTYNDAVDAAEETLSAFLDERTALRQDSLLADARQTLADAGKTLDEKTQALADAKKALADGKGQLADGWASYDSGTAALAENRQKAADELAAAEAALESGEVALAENRQKLAEKSAELSSAEKSLAEGAAKLKDGRAQYDAGAAELAAQRSAAEQRLADARKTLDESAEQISGAQAALDAQREELDDAAAKIPDRSTVPDEIWQAYYAAAYEQVQAGYRQLAAAEQQLAAAKEQLAAGRAEYHQAEDEAAAELSAAQQKLDSAKAELDRNQREYDDAAAQLESGRAQLESGKTQLAAAEQELETGRARAEAAKADAAQQLAAAEEQLASAKTELEQNEKTLADSEQEIQDGEQQLAEAEQEYADGQAKLADTEAPAGYLLKRGSNVGYACFESDSDIVKGVSRVFPLFFFMVAALVCITTMTRMVEEQRTQVGVLKALGYGRAAIFSEYAVYAGSASVLGCAAGALAGSYFLPKMIWHAYNIMYGFADILWAFDWPLVLISSFGYLVCALAATWYACSQELSRPAAELMRPKAPRAGRRVLLERIPFIWKRVSFLHKVSIRNILRYKKRMVMMAIGIGGCTALLITGYGIRDSIRNVVDYQYEEITKYDLSVSFSQEQDGAARRSFRQAHADTATSCLFVSTASLECTKNSVTKTVTAVAAEGGSTQGFVDLHSGAAPVAYPKDGECVINSGLARALGASAGDTLTLRTADGRAFTAVVSGIFDNYVYNYVYLTEASWEDGMGEPAQYKEAWICVKAGADLHEAAVGIAKDADVSNVLVNADLRARVGRMLDSLNYIVYVVIVCAGALAFIVLYNLTNINITERLREIATVKVLGFYNREAEAYVFRENLVLTLLGILAGIPMGIWLHRYVMEQIRIDMVAFDIRIAGTSYLCAAAFTVAFSLIVNFVMGFRIRGIHMAEALKSIE